HLSATRTSPAEAVPCRAARSTTAGWRVCRSFEPAAQNQAADGADIHDDLFAVITADFPAHQSIEECGFFFELFDLYRKVIQCHGLPSGRFEWWFEGSGVAFRRAFFFTKTPALAKPAHRRGDRRDPERLQQLPARDSLFHRFLRLNNSPLNQTGA